MIDNISAVRNNMQNFSLVLANLAYDPLLEDHFFSVIFPSFLCFNHNSFHLLIPDVLEYSLTLCF